MTSMMAAGTVLGSLSGGWMLELSGMTTMLFVNVIIALLGVGFALISVKNKRLLSKAC
jgi:predicted MFS family arabinose efflux permease